MNSPRNYLYHVFCWLAALVLSTSTRAQVNTVVTNPSVCPLGISLTDNNCPENSNFYNPDIFTIQVTNAPGTLLGLDVYLQQVKLLVEHPWVSDLNFALRSPSGHTVELLGDFGGNGDNFGDTSLVNCTGAMVLELATCTSISDGQAPFTDGPYRAIDDFYGFNDSITNPNGSWELLICDDLEDDVGVLQYVELVFAPLACLPPQTLTIIRQDSTAVTFTYDPVELCGPVIVEFGPVGFIPGIADNPSSEGVTFLADCPPFTINGLAEDTAYDVYLRRYCTVMDTYSTNSCTISLQTGCNPGTVTEREHFDDQTNCAPICTFPCEFTGDWRNTEADDLDWIVYSGSTPTTFRTGPDDDISGGGKYVYLEANGFQCPAGSEGILQGACVTLDKMGRDSCHLSFNYHMSGTHIGSLRVEASADGGQTWQQVWERIGSQSPDWQTAYVSLRDFTDGATLQVRLIGVKGNGIFGDIAVDELKWHGSTIVGYPTNYLYTDSDGDGFGAMEQGVLTCLAAAPPGFVFNNEDCDDNVASVFPGAPEIPCNGVDENCNGTITDDDIVLPPPLTTNDTICSGDIPTLTAVAPPDFQVFWYTTPTKEQGIVGFGPSFQPTLPANETPFDQSYTFYPEVTNFVCGTPILGEVTVVVRPVPAGELLDTPAVCPGESIDLKSVNIQDNNFTGGILSFHRSLPTTASNQITTAVFPTEDSLFYYQIESPFGCTYVDSLQIAQRAIPSISFLPADSFSLCRNLTDTLRASATSGTGDYTFQWSDGRTSTTFPVQAGVSPGALTSYPLAVVDSLGCVGLDTVLVLTTNSIDSLRSFTQDVTTCIGADGEIAIVPLNGLAPFSYVWEDEAGNTGGGDNVLDTIRISNLPQNSYRVTLTDSSAEGCEVSLRNLRIQGPGFQVADATVVSPSCHNTDDGQICLDVTGSGTITYSWSNGQSTACASSLASGMYSVTISNGECTTVEAFELRAPTALALAWQAMAPSCNEEDNGTLSVNVFGGTPPYNYDWGDGAISPGIVNLTTGNYTVSITDSRGCMLIDDFSLTAPSPLAIALDANADVSCPGQVDGFIQIAGTGGTAPYDYLWENGSTSPLLANLDGGDYEVTLTDFNGCATSATYTVSVPAPLEISLLTTQLPICQGDSTGEISLAVIGGTAPVTFQWSDGWMSGSSTRDQLPVGDYQVWVSDVNNCTSDTLTITLVPQSDLALSIVVDDPTCVGLSDGDIMVSASGQNPQQFMWGDGASSAARSNLSVGDYPLTITDGRGCVADTVISVTATQVFEIVSSVSQPSCFEVNDGIIDQILIQQGLPPFAFRWSDNTQHVDQMFLGPGSYQFTVTDALGCEFISDTFQMTYPEPLSLEVVDRGELSCAGDDNGYLETMAAGGNAPFSYNWVGTGNTSSNIYQLTAGEHRLSVTDVNGCAIDTIFEFIDPPPLAIDAELIRGNVCDPDDADVLLSTVSGGSMPYSYEWTDRSTEASVINPAPGDYFLSVTDEVGCLGVFGTVKVQEREAPLVLDSFRVDQVGCFGGNDAVMTAFTSGGSGNFRYHFTPTFITETDTNFVQVSGISFDNSYSVTVTDLATDCEVSSVVIPGSQPEPITIRRDSFSTVNCFGGADGALYMTVAGGTGDYNYLWQNEQGETIGAEEDLTFIQAGIYQLLVTDENDCEAVHIDSNVIAINELIVLAESEVVPAVCRGEASGAIDITVEGGLSPYRYSWSNDAQTEDLTDISAGLYSLTVTDADTCSAIFPGIEVGEPATTIELMASVDSLSCFDGQDGQIVTEVSGGVMPYSYLWRIDGILEPTLMGSVASDLTAATYTVEVMDSVGCIQTWDIELPAPPAIQIEILNQPAGSDSLQAVVNGGTPPYSYLWSTGDTTATATGLPPSLYDLLVTDANGCLQAESYLLTHLSALDLSKSWKLFPNPATDILRLQLREHVPASETQRMVLLDASGRLLSIPEYQNGAREWTWQVGALSAGRYGLWIEGEGVLWWVKQ